MAPPSSLISKLKVQLKLSIARLQMVQQKDAALAKQQRRAMAQLLEQNKIESARIRVENIIRSDITTELHEILELYCELLLARHQLLDQNPSIPGSSAKAPSHPSPDPGLEEAVRSVVYAAPRTDVKELHAVRALLVEKFGKDYALSAMEGEGVSDRVLNKLKIESPRRELVDAYLTEIAKTYQINWPPKSVEEQLGEDEEDVEEDDKDDDDNPSGGQKIKVAEEAAGPKGTQAQKKEDKPKAKPKPRDGSGGGPGGSVPDADDLSARFASLLRGGK